MAFGAMLGSMLGKLGGAGGLGKVLGGLGQGGLKAAWQGAGGMGGLLGMGGQKMFEGGGSNMLANLFGKIGGGEQSPLGVNAQAMVGTQQEPTLRLDSGQTSLNPILLTGSQMGGQFGYNAPQAGMKGLQNMGGLLGSYSSQNPEAFNMNKSMYQRGGY